MQALRSPTGTPKLRRYHVAGFDVAVHFALGPARDECERELAQAGFALPLPHRAAWARALRPTASWFLAAYDASGRPCAGFAVEVHRSRALPGHLLLRVERLGAAGACAASEACLAVLAGIARRRWRVLRVGIELYEPDVTARDSLCAALRSLGFETDENGRAYHQTLFVDLTADLETVRTRLSRNTRRNIRIIANHGLSVRVITDPSLAPRMDFLLQETPRRTGGNFEAQRIASRIAFSADCPWLARFVGLFRADVSGPESLIAFVSGYHHGTYAHYDAGASVRTPDVKAPLAYALVWDLIVWAKANGARWFDLGGVTGGTLGSDDPLGGLSDFKRFFGDKLITVGDDWVLNPRTVQTWAAHAVSICAATASTLVTWLIDLN